MKDVRKCERLPHATSVEIKREDLIATRHSQRQGERAFEGRAELLCIRAYVIKPPGIGFIEPRQQRRITKIVTRHVSIVQQSFDVFFSERLRIVFNEGLGFGPGPLRRVVRQHPRLPSLQVVAQVWLARQRQSHGAKLQAANYVQLEAEPADTASIESVLSLH